VSLRRQDSSKRYEAYLERLLIRIAHKETVMAVQPQLSDALSTDHLHADLKGRSVRGGLLTLISQGSQFVLQTVSTVALARLLVPADFGLVAMVTAVTGLASAFADFGLSEATIQRKKITHEQVSTLFWPPADTYHRRHGPHIGEILSRAAASCHSFAFVAQLLYWWAKSAAECTAETADEIFGFGISRHSGERRRYSSRHHYGLAGSRLLGVGRSPSNGEFGANDSLLAAGTLETRSAATGQRSWFYACLWGECFSLLFDFQSE